MPNELNDGGPAYPFPGIPTDGTDMPWLVPPYPGMSMRQRYKLAAMKDCMMDPQLRSASEETFASYVGKLADALLAEDKSWEAKQVTEGLAAKHRASQAKGQEETSDGRQSTD